MKASFRRGSTASSPTAGDALARSPHDETARAANVVEQVGKAQRPEPPNCWGSEAALIEQGAELQLQLDRIKP
jgi:hypothetical protein